MVYIKFGDRYSSHQTTKSNDPKYSGYTVCTLQYTQLCRKISVLDVHTANSMHRIFSFILISVINTSDSFDFDLLNDILHMGVGM